MKFTSTFVQNQKHLLIYSEFAFHEGWMMKSNLALFIAMLFFMIILSGAVSAQLNSSEGTCWKFAVLCDTRGNDTNTTGKSGINDTILKALSEEIVKEHCDLVLVPGDMINGWFNHSTATYEGQFNNWTKAMGQVYGNNISIYAVRGNHEDGPGSYSRELGKEVPPYNTTPDRNLIRAFNNTFGFNHTSGLGNPTNGPAGEVNLTYSFTHKNALFVGLDEYAKPHRVNQEWLDNQLKKNNLPFVFVFGHEPAFQINHPDCLAYNSINRSKFWDTIGQAGCQIYFCGHDHLYDRAHIPDSSGNKIYQMVIGSCGAPMKRWTPPYMDGSVIGDSHNNNKTGYVLVTMRNNNTALVEWKAWNAGISNWTTQDSFELNGKENRHGIPWTTLEYILLILSGLVAIGGMVIMKIGDSNGNAWSMRNFKNELNKSLKGDDCGKYEGYITAITIIIAIPLTLAACWIFGPMYRSEGIISADQARTVVQGVTIFAVVYFITQLIERIVELISGFHPLFKDTRKIEKLRAEVDQKNSQIKENFKNCLNADVEDAKTTLEELMEKRDCLESSRKSRLWAVASGIGIIFSYIFIGLFALVGITTIPHWVDVLISGIILGGGSKPLHDLISNMEKK